jgi:glycosyltransferase involved in cell wall biosynthesis
MYVYHNENHNENYENKPIITFVIPTIGRPTLTRTINSLKKLNNKNWKAIIVFDGIEPNIIKDDDRITIIRLDKKEGKDKNSAGNVRNKAYEHVDTEWIGFVDDDDTLNPQYIDYLVNLENTHDLDVLIFRMIYEDGKVLPKHGDHDFKESEVGISFCLRRQLAIENPFVPSKIEDFVLLDKLRSKHKKILISEYIGYNVGM